MNTIEVALQHQLGEFDLDISFSTPAFGVTALFGRSGSGKTSVLRAIAGLIRASRGEVKVNGEVWQNSRQFLPTHQRPIGYVFQEASLFSHFSVKRNLEFGLGHIRKSDRKVDYHSAVELLGIGPLVRWS